MGERIAVAAYCRVSSGGEEQSGSFAAQQRYFADIIAKEPEWELVEIYADEGKSGTDTHGRAAFNRMMTDAAGGRFSLLLTKEVSRFSRNILDTIRCVRALRRYGAAVLFLNDGIDTRQPEAELRLSIMGSLAQEESRRTSERVKWGQLRQMEQGVVFGRSLLGYTVQNGRLTPEPQGAETVRRIFALYARRGLGTGRIAKMLQAEGVPTHSGGAWQAGTVAKILQNEKYVGDLIQKKSRTPDYLTHKKEKNRGEEPLIVLRGHHEGIIDRALWEAAQQERQRRRRCSGALACANRYALSGKIRCGVCGGVFTAKRQRNAKGEAYLKWGCRKGCGIGRMLRQQTAAELIKRAIAGADFDRERAYAQLLAAVKAVTETGTGQKTEERLKQVRENRRRLWEHYLSGEMTAEDMAALKRRYEERERLLLEKQRQKQDRTALFERLEALAHGEVSDAMCRELTESITVERERVTVVLHGPGEAVFAWGTQGIEEHGRV